MRQLRNLADRVTHLPGAGISGPLRLGGSGEAGIIWGDLPIDSLEKSLKRRELGPNSGPLRVFLAERRAPAVNLRRWRLGLLAEGRQRQRPERVGGTGGKRKRTWGSDGRWKASSGMPCGNGGGRQAGDRGIAERGGETPKAVWGSKATGKRKWSLKGSHSRGGWLLWHRRKVLIDPAGFRSSPPRWWRPQPKPRAAATRRGPRAGPAECGAVPGKPFLSSRDSSGSPAEEAGRPPPSAHTNLLRQWAGTLRSLREVPDC